MKAFMFWCQKVLPLVYDDSLSYYEVLCKISHKINEIIKWSDNVNSNLSVINNTIEKIKKALEVIESKIENILNENVYANKVVTNRLKNWNSDYTFTNNGMSYKNEADKSIKMWGTKIADAVSVWTVGTAYLTKGVYTLQGCPPVSDPSTTGYRLQCNLMTKDAYGQWSDSREILAIDTGSGKSFTMEADSNVIVYIITGTATPGIAESAAVVFKPMIYAGTGTVGYAAFEKTGNEITNESFSRGDARNSQDISVANNMLDTALSFIKFNTGANPVFSPTDNTKIYYNPDTADGVHMFNPTLSPNANADGKYSMTCSTMVGACLFDIPYEASCYAHAGLQVLGKYQCDKYKYYENFLSNKYFAAKLYNSMLEDGYIFEPNSNYSNIHPGDILFFADKNVSIRNYGNITHCAVFGYWCNDNVGVIVECNLLPKFTRVPKTTLRSRGLTYVGRPPIGHKGQRVYENIVTAQTPISEKLGLNLTVNVKRNKLYTCVIKAPQNEDVNVYYGVAKYNAFATQWSASASGAINKPNDDTYIIPFVPTEDAKNVSVYRYHGNLPVDSITAPNYEFVGVFEGLVTGW